MSTQGIHSRLTLMEQNSTLDGTPQDQLLVGSTHLGDRSMVTELQDMEQSGVQTLLEVVISIKQCSTMTYMYTKEAQMT